MLPPMFIRHFASALTATSLVVCAAFALAGCGQKGELYLPAKNGSEAGYAERKNAKSHFIFGSNASKTTTNSAASAPTQTASASEPTAIQAVTGGSAS